LLSSAASGRSSLRQLARHVAMTEEVGRDLLRRVQSRARELKLWSDKSIVAELLKFGEAGTRQGERLERSKVRTWSILPMNILNITGKNRADWEATGCGDPFLDFRMCEDVLWWSMLHMKSHEFWRA
jgi:hypothetical protein